MQTRREFLGMGAAGLSLVTLGGFAPRLLAQAARESALADQNDHALVVIELTGGNDGLNTLIPFENDLYYKNRPTLGIAKGEAIKLADGIGLHPAMIGAAELFKQGRLAIVQGVGYPDPDRSHFRSMEIWHTASVERVPPTSGWIGRVLDSHEADKQQVPALALTGSLPQAMQADRTAVPVVSQLDAVADMGQQGPGSSEALTAKLAMKSENMKGAGMKEGSMKAGSAKNGTAKSGGAKLSSINSQSTSAGGAVGFVREQWQTMQRTAERLKTAKANYKSTVEYPQVDLCQQLQRAAQILSARLGVRVLYVSQDGYDTHSGQGPAHANLLTQLSESLAAFQKDLDQLKLADKVVVMVFSEFGRRVDENGSQGTDHGAASCMLIEGAPVRGGLVGEHPSLEKLGDGDLIYHTDFRQVYATLLGEWLGCSSERILGKEFAALELVRAS